MTLVDSGGERVFSRFLGVDGKCSEPTIRSYGLPVESCRQTHFHYYRCVLTESYVDAGRTVHHGRVLDYFGGEIEFVDFYRVAGRVNRSESASATVTPDVVFMATEATS